MNAVASVDRAVVGYESGRELTVAGNIVAFTQDESTQAALAMLAESGVAPNTSVVPGGLSTAVAAGAPDCAVLLVDITDSPDPVADIQHLAEHGAKHIVATGPVNDVTLYRALTEAGAVDYLVSPIAEAELARALTARRRGEVAEVTELSSVSSAVIGARGGVGATTVSVSLAWLLAHEYDQRTALLDLDLQFGTCALALDLLPGRGLREALESPDRIDSMFVSSAMVNESENLYVLGGEEPLEDSLFVSPDGIDMLFTSIQPDFNHLVIDLPRSMVTCQRSLLSRMANILLVSDLSLPGMRDTVRLKNLVREASPDATLEFVVVEGQDRRTTIDRPDFERGIEAKIAHVVPFDARTTADAANNGKAVPATGGGRKPLLKSFRRMASGIVRDVEPVKRRWFKK
ncbi:MAG: pilus assembly protein CpaE [Alphaproteobacteria bacterium]|nr:pilus assembly protein CpaE [Alphaproteobacteria bacterium]